MSPADEVNSALISSGFGKFNIIVLLIAIPGSWAIMFATSTISFIVGRAECDLKLSLGDIGTLNGMPYIGMLIFTIPWAILSDNIGRRKVAIISYILDGFIVLLCSFSQTKYELIILKFLNGATICGAFSVLMTYVSEVHTGIMRTRALYFIGICLTVAPLLLPTMAVVIVPKKWEISYGGFNYYSWNLFLLISASPSLICGVAFIFMPESPKFDAAKNNFNKALKTLQTIFKMNTGKSIEEYPIKSLVTEEVSEELTMKQRFQEGWSRFTEMFQKKYIFLALNIFFVEFCILMCQNSFRLWLPKIFETMKQFQEEGKSVNSFCDVLSMVQSSSVAKQHGKCESNITWESYINNFYVAIASVLGFIITAILLTVINPKKLFSASLGVSLIFSMVLIVATNEVSIVSLIAIYLAAENIASTSVFNACLHLFPTNLRNTVLGFGMTLGRLGSFIGNRIFPYIISFNCIVFFVWIGVLGAEKMKINAKMATPIEEKIEKNLKVRIGMVNMSDGKCKPEPLRLKLSMEVLTLQKVELVTPTNQSSGPPMEVKERMVQITRQKQGGLGLSIKGGAEHKLPILISRIYKDQAADISGQLFVGDAIIKVNGEYITACPHDDAVNILRNAGDIVVLTVKHYRAATPFLQKQLTKDTPDSDNDATCAELKADEIYKSAINGTGGTMSRSCSRPASICSESERKWVDVITVPLMMAYVTRYIYGTDKLRSNAFEVRGLNGVSTGVIHCDDSAILNQWLKLITDNVVGLTHLQMKLYNRNFPLNERIEYMGWVNEGIINNNISWQSYKPRFLVLKATEVMLFETPPLNVAGLSKPLITYKVYQTMFRIVKESETVDSRQHCFLLQSSGHEPRYLSVEMRQELLRVEHSWNAAIVTSVIKLGQKTFAVSHHGKSAGLTLDWQTGFALVEGADSSIVWQYKFSQLRGSSDDGKSKLKLHFQDHETRTIETKELECQVLQSLLFCMHAFLTAKVASVDPTFFNSIQT